MVLVGAGAVEHDQVWNMADFWPWKLLELSDKYFGKLSHKLNHNPSDLAPVSFKGGQIYNSSLGMKFQWKRIKGLKGKPGEAMIGIAFPGVSWSDPDYFVFQVLQNLLGTWDNTLGKACLYLIGTG